MFTKAIVLLLYMSYPSLARQSFAFWHCVGIQGRWVSKMMMVPYTLILQNIYVNRWMDILGKVMMIMGMATTSYMATELRCWDQRHLISLHYWVTTRIFYVIGLPLVAFIILWRHRRSGNLKKPEMLFCYGLLYDGYRDYTCGGKCQLPTRKH